MPVHIMPVKLKAQWLTLKDKTAALSLRERGILAAVVVVVVLFVWLQFVYTPFEKLQISQKKKLSQIEQQIGDQSQRLVELTELLGNNPNEPLWAKQKELTENLIQLKTDIETRLGNLIAPEQMADVLKTVLSDYKGLTLLSARNLPVEPIKMPNVGEKNVGEKNVGEKAEPASGQKPAAPQAVIFAHGFEMVLGGSYFQVLEFLERLEGMKGFYWQGLDYQVQTYPNAKITIQISTLSMDEDWIGV